MNVDAKLTAEENRVVQFVAWGCPYKIIADRLCKSVHTVTNQIRSACEKIGITPGELPAWWFCTHFGDQLRSVADQAQGRSDHAADTVLLPDRELRFDSPAGAPRPEK